MSNVIELAFKNTASSTEEWIAFIACKHCKNKTYTLTEDNPESFPLLKCAACGMHIGRIGWAK